MRLNANSLWALIILALAAVSGCGGLAKNQPLLEAEKTYAEAKRNETVLKYAPAELERAEKAINLAASAESDEEMASLAYIGKTRTLTAVAVAERKAAKVKLDELGQIKNTERLKARELEIAYEQEAKGKALQEREQALARAEAVTREREEALARAETLRKELEELQAVKTERGIVMTLEDVLFSTGKAELQPGAMSTIERLANFLAEYPSKTVLIEGHTDSVGTDDYNQSLSERRAASVRIALMEENVEPARIKTIGYGESRPIADNTTSAGRLKNRRVEIVIRD